MSDHLAEGRSALEALEGRVRLQTGGGLWTTARLGLGPWAARIVLDAVHGVLRCESQVHGVIDTSPLQQTLQELPFPAPKATYELTPGPADVTLLYEIPLHGLNQELAYGPCLFLAAATSTVAYQMWDMLSPLELARLGELSILRKEDLNSAPSQYLLSSPVPHSEWDQAAVPRKKVVKKIAPVKPAALAAHPVDRGAADGVGSKRAPVEPKARAEAPAVRSPQQTLMEWLGAVPSSTQSDGTVHFKLGDLSGGVTPLTARSVRAWLLIASDVEPGRASRWIAHNKRVGSARLQLSGTRTGKAIYLVCQVRTDQSKPRDLFSADTATALQLAWKTRGSTVRMFRQLSRTAIAVPPFGSVPEQDIDTYGDSHWGSRFIDAFDLYMFEIDQIAEVLRRDGRFFAFAHAGHGISSYGLSLVTSAGPVAAYVQHHWGGLFSDPISAPSAINATYARLRELMRLAALRNDDPLRWLLVLSNFRGVYGIIDLRRHMPGESFEKKMQEFDEESELFRALANKLQITNDDKFAENVDW